ncbi:MAG: alpha/beta fold hydrolase [Bacteriovoracaceae bacterium]
MPVKIKFQTLNDKRFQFNAAAFIPDSNERKSYCAVFTHGYTASKSSILPWAQRLSEAGIPTVIFDLPGHYLGSINEVESFENFTERAHHCFHTAAEFLLQELGDQYKATKFILGGHSLGALLSLKALDIFPFNQESSLAVAVGLGIGQHKSDHLFETSFYEKTLNIRRQLVCPELDSDLVFPWIKEEKASIAVKSKRAHLITGADDVVVGPGGMEALKRKLEENGNQVSALEPKKLPHHEPGAAAAHIYHFLKKELEL